MPGYLPIAEHGIMGDLHTVALTGTDGNIDWYCCPSFDSPSVFASILDKEKGGHYRIAPVAEDWTPKQLYFPDTNVLITRFLTEEGVGEIQGFMPIAESKEDIHRHRLIRRVEGVRGEMRFRVEMQPRFNYGRDKHEIEQYEHGVVFRSPNLCLALQATTPVACDETGIHCEFTVRAGSSVTFVLERVEPDYVPREYSEAETRAAYEQTIAFWRNWLSRSQYKGRWREMVNRSALTLKLLTYRPTGAIVAAPTTSLPEVIGGGRNWDYRYTWIRDAAFSLYALLRLGFTDEAEAFTDWLRDRVVAHTDAVSGPLQIMYGIDGRSELTEETLDHFEGYRGSKPVRIGNGAYDQLQLDIYGELMDSVYLFNKYGRPIAHDGWVELSALTDWLCENWDQPDEGIWEVRGGRQDFTYSRLMCWVAIERAIRIASHRGLPADLDTLARGPRRDLPPDHEQGLERGAPGLRPALRHRRPRRVAPAHAAREVHRADRSALALDPRCDHEGARLRQPGLPLQRAGLARRARGARRARSRSARSGTSRRSRGRAGSKRRGSPSRRCSPTRTTSGSSRRRSGPRESSSATSRRPSPTSR